MASQIKSTLGECNVRTLLLLPSRRLSTTSKYQYIHTIFSEKISFCLNKTIIAYVSSFQLISNRSVAFCINRFHRCVYSPTVSHLYQAFVSVICACFIWKFVSFDVLSYRYVHTLKFLLIRTKAGMRKYSTTVQYGTIDLFFNIRKCTYSTLKYNDNFELLFK